MKPLTLVVGTVALSCVNLFASEIAFTQDALSRRVEKRVGGARAKTWLWSDGLKIAGELDDTNGVTARFIYAGGANVPSHVVKGTNAFHLISDPRGSVRLVVNAQTGEIAQPARLRRIWPRAARHQSRLSTLW
ncbi:MAG: hypothetical protein L0Z50_02295, partial [Verrucomicrobiales bacterium]|nr:hypothetical protein [Verrucomicrobiales bacterium]